mmetsp:Transcript_62649/g.149484  ORF Transcript_62649/g.149484 Transcript_62649/m.149484 type:complete len:570 (-) Transcript_62649:107-1816(-)
MVLGDITNLASSRGQLGEQKAERLRSRSKSQERIAPRPGYDPAEKAARANALWDQKQRIEALMEELLPKRLRAKELRRALSEVEQRSAARAAELNSQKEESELQMFKLHEGSAEISSQLAALSAQLLAEEETHRRLQVGVQAKESSQSHDRQTIQALVDAKAAAEATAESQRLRAVELCASAAAARDAAGCRGEVLAQNVPRARALHNGLMNLKGNVRVFCRVRPALPWEQGEQEQVDCLDEQRLTVRSEVMKSVTGLSEQRTTWDFNFDHVFAPRSSQAEVFEELAMLVQSALDGYRVAIFAYGQTGGGKTHTMDGPPEDREGSVESRGVIPRTVDLIFQEVEDLCAKGWQFDVSATLLEVYNEAVYDILAPRKDQRAACGTDSRQAVEQFVTRKVTDAAAVHRLLAKAAQERHVAATACNDRSSRSHAVFQLALNGQRWEEDRQETVSGLLSLVDLAGSERVEKSQATGERLKEARFINRSLSALGDVIEALSRRGSDGTGHVPYRNSRLTMLLKSSLSGDSKALMFVNVSPCLCHLNETLASLRFAAKVHDCNVGVARRYADNGKV